MDYLEQRSAGELPAIAVGRLRVDRDLRVEITLLPHHVAKDFLEATDGLAFKRKPQPQVSAVRPKPFAQRLKVGLAELLSADDLYAGDDVVSLHWQATNASQLALLASDAQTGELRAMIAPYQERAPVSLTNFFTSPSTALSIRLSGFLMSMVFTS